MRNCLNVRRGAKGWAIHDFLDCCQRNYLWFLIVFRMIQFQTCTARYFRHRTASNRFLWGAPALSPSKKLPNPWQREFKSPHVSSCLETVEHSLMQRWNILRRKQKLYLPEQEITQSNLSRGSNQEVWVRGVVGVQTLIKQRFRHITKRQMHLIKITFLTQQRWHY